MGDNTREDRRDAGDTDEAATPTRGYSWTPSTFRDLDIDEIIAMADQMERVPIRRYTSMGDRPHLRHRRTLASRLRAALPFFSSSSRRNRQGSADASSSTTPPTEPRDLRLARLRRSSIDLAHRPSPARSTSSLRPLNFQPGALTLHTEPLRLDGAESSPDEPLSPWRAARVRYVGTTHVGTYDDDAPPAEQYFYNMRMMPYPGRNHPSLRLSDYLRFMEPLIPQIGSSDELSPADEAERDDAIEVAARTQVALGPSTAGSTPDGIKTDQEATSRSKQGRLDSVAIGGEDVPSIKLDESESSETASAIRRRYSSSHYSTQSAGSDQDSSAPGISSTSIVNVVHDLPAPYDPLSPLYSKHKRPSMFVWGAVVSQGPIKGQTDVHREISKLRSGFEVNITPTKPVPREDHPVTEMEAISAPTETELNDTHLDDNQSVKYQQTKGLSATLSNLWSISPFRSLRRQQLFAHGSLPAACQTEGRAEPEPEHRSSIFTSLNRWLDRVCDELMPEPSPVKPNIGSVWISPSNCRDHGKESLVTESPVANPPDSSPLSVSCTSPRRKAGQSEASELDLMGDWTIDFESAVRLLDRESKNQQNLPSPSSSTTRSTRFSANASQPKELSYDDTSPTDIGGVEREPFRWDYYSSALLSGSECVYPDSIRSSEEPYTVMMVRVPEVTEPLRHIFRPFHDSVRSLIGVGDHEAPQAVAEFPPDFYPDNIVHEPPQDTFNESYGNALAEDYITLALFSTFSKPKKPLTADGLARVSEQDAAKQKEESVLNLFRTGVRRPFVDILLRCGRLRPTISRTTTITQTVEHITPPSEAVKPEPCQMQCGHSVRESSTAAGDPVEAFWKQAAARKQALETAGEFELLPNENLDWNTFVEPGALKESVRALQIAKDINETATRARLALESLQRAPGVGSKSSGGQDDEAVDHVTGEASEEPVSPYRRSAFSESMTSEDHFVTPESTPVLFRDVWQPSISARASPASLRSQQDSHPEAAIHNETQAAIGSGKKRDSTVSEGRTPPPIPPRPKRRTLSQSSEKNKENVASPSSPSSTTSSEHRRRSLRFNLDSTSRGWKPLASKSSADVSVHGDSVGRGSGSIRESLKMTPIAKPGETVDDAMARVSQLRRPERPSVGELAQSEHQVRLVNVSRSAKHVEKKSPGSYTPFPTEASNTHDHQGRSHREDGPEIDCVARATDGPERLILKRDFAEYKNYLRESKRTGRDASELLQMPKRREQFLREWLGSPGDGEFCGIQWFTHKGQKEGALLEGDRLQEIGKEESVRQHEFEQWFATELQKPAAESEIPAHIRASFEGDIVTTQDNIHGSSRGSPELHRTASVKTIYGKDEELPASARSPSPSSFEELLGPLSL